ncbi:MAG: hypothetical protein J2P15_12720, partial [Micromonosporaceae bacterium]|nr:hypothetical protein [Micromonosporaceae bacterium]
MTTPHPGSKAWPRRAWAAFRGWRQSRPFWGSLLLVLAGIELLASGHSSLGGISISTGPQGFLAYVLPALLLLCGLLTWLSPAQRIFYAIIAALTALYALIGLNLGGWFLGTLLGIVGSAMTFGWGPGSSARAGAGGEATPPGQPHAGQAQDAPEAPAAGPDHPGDAREESAPHAEVDTRHGGGPNGRTALAVLPLLLATSVALAVAVAPRTAYAKAAADPSPTSAPAQTSPAAQPTDTSPAASVEPTPAPDPTGPGPTRTPTAVPTMTATPTRTPQPAASASSSLIASSAPGQGIVSLVPATMSASVLTLSGFAYDGVATLPTGNGPLATLKFTMDAASNQDFELVVGGVSDSLAITGDPVVARGRVALYTTRFSGRLLGIPLTFTPEDPPPAVLPTLV